ncbi:hypothetical protein TNCV_2090931 [Trichonephila clavipes]|nr:hypothetical protein TNCV_2090931 [Trichonephila clavipes]
MASTRCYVTSARGHGAIAYCLNSVSANTQTGSHNGKGEACLERILSPRPVSIEWDNRTQVETREEPCPGSRELVESAKESDLVRDWTGKEEKTMDTSGVGESV